MSATPKDSSSDNGEVALQIYRILKDISSEDRARIIKATVLLLGDEPTHSRQSNQHSELFPKEDIGSSKNETGTSQDYFNLKEPANKGELLAVAARFLEKSENTESSKRDQIKKAILDSRRNFDAANFLRDMKNATSQAGFFNKGGSNGEYALSYFGQQFVDALPDRVAAKAIKRPGTKKKPAAKKKAK